jgi:hypothetical protein
MGASEFGDLLPSARAADAAEEDAGVMKAFDQSVGGGKSWTQSLLSMSSEEKSTVLEEAGLPEGTQLSDLSPEAQAKVLQNLKNPTGMTEAAEQNAKLLHIKSLPLKTAIDYGFDKAVTEPLQDYDQRRIDALLGVPASG